MGRILFIAAAILFFLAGVGSLLIPNAVTWGLFALALGLAVGGSLAWSWGPRNPS